jgi:allophycocyanin beta subunit
MNKFNKNFISKEVHSTDIQETYQYDTAPETLRPFILAGELRVKAVNTICVNSTEIISQAVNKSLILSSISSGGSVHIDRHFSCFCRDLDYVLRYCTYAMFVGDASILLNGLVETYYALDVSIDDTVKAIQAMKEVVTQFIGEDAGTEIAGYFDYLCAGLSTSTPIISRQEIQRQENTPVEACVSWEPKNYQEWLKTDKLAQQLQKNGVDDQDAFKASALAFFEAWSRMPSELKRKVWREREVMAELCEKMNSWKEIPGFLSVGVAQRMIDNNEQLAGILNFEASDLPREQYYKKFNIPTFLKVESSINPTEGKQQELIPIIIESMESLVKYNSSDVESAVAISETKTPKKVSSPVLTLQSGDIIVGRNKRERFNESQTVTLTTFVYSQDISGSFVQQVLSVNHGFKAGYEEAYTCEIEPYNKIGRTNYSSPRQKECAEKLDVALFRIENQVHKTNTHLKWIDETPERPIPVYAHMPVQMYGGVSKHQTGYIDQSMTIFPGSASSVVPFFTANISSQPGDSGTLLVSGHYSENQVPYMNEKYSSIRNAMLGMLIEGSRGTNGSVTVFRPMMDILSQLKISVIN